MTSRDPQTTPSCQRAVAAAAGAHTVRGRGSRATGRGGRPRAAGAGAAGGVRARGARGLPG